MHTGERQEQQSTMQELLELERMGLIERRGFRNGQVVWVAIPYERLSDSARRVLRQLPNRVDAPTPARDLS